MNEKTKRSTGKEIATATLAKAKERQMRIFDENRLFAPEDAEMRLFGDTHKLAQWRCKKHGPPYYTIGRKIRYKGEDLNAWLLSQRQETQDSKRISAKHLADKARRRMAEYEKTEAENGSPNRGATS